MKETFKIIFQKESASKIPRATVIISLYNYKDYIISCLESVQSQTLKNLDLIIVDDCSTDGSLEFARDWLVKNSKYFSDCLLLCQKSNQGLPRTRNLAFTHARTEYVFVLDADNLLYPRCLERLSSALGNCDASFSYCSLEGFGSLSRIQNFTPWNPDTFQYHNKIDAMVLIRKSVWEKVGGYSVMEYQGWEDFDLWFKIARIKGWGVLVPEILAKYRVHFDSMYHTEYHTNQLWSYFRSHYPEFFNKKF